MVGSYGVEDVGTKVRIVSRSDIRRVHTSICTQYGRGRYGPRVRLRLDFKLDCTTQHAPSQAGRTELNKRSSPWAAGALLHSCLCRTEHRDRNTMAEPWIWNPGLYLSTGNRVLCCTCRATHIQSSPSPSPPLSPRDANCILVRIVRYCDDIEFLALPFRAPWSVSSPTRASWPRVTTHDALRPLQRAFHDVRPALSRPRSNRRPWDSRRPCTWLTSHHTPIENSSSSTRCKKSIENGGTSCSTGSSTATARRPTSLE